VSHIVVIQTKLRDPAALTAACARLRLAAPTQGTVELFSGTVSGLVVPLPGWTYPVVVDVQTGEVRFDNYEGRWGDPKELDRLLQACAVEKCRMEARKNNLLTLHRGDERFDGLGGLANLEEFCRRAVRPGRAVKPRGVLLLGVPGTGKSAFAKALGNEVGRPTLLLDVGALMGSLVGQTEANVRQALKVADAMSPAILFCDEIEKALSGVGGQGDSGVSTRLFGTLLTWLSDRPSAVFFIGTANDVSRLPPEFTRAERFDGIFFLDLPTAVEKDAVWAMYRRQFQIPDAQVRPDDTSWTGAEIKSCCRLAALLDVTLTQAAHHVVPVAITASEQVERLRTWASGRCLSASAPGIFHRDGEPAVKPGRRVQRGPNNN
jgi:ATPase family associated with various cellular activities (AAA)